MNKLKKSFVNLRGVVNAMSDLHELDMLKEINPDRKNADDHRKLINRHINMAAAENPYFANAIESRRVQEDEIENMFEQPVKVYDGNNMNNVIDITTNTLVVTKENGKRMLYENHEWTHSGQKMDDERYDQLVFDSTVAQYGFYPSRVTRFATDSQAYAQALSPEQVICRKLMERSDNEIA
ncbi:MAG: hypothetical protein FWE45_03305 [Firmicutes bacterium]|nr:hypothetical protein [Bacillota bacterium]